MTSMKNKIKNMTPEERKCYNLGYRKGFGRCLGLLINFTRKNNIKFECMEVLADIKDFMLAHKPHKRDNDNGV